MMIEIHRHLLFEFSWSTWDLGFSYVLPKKKEAWTNACNQEGLKVFFDKSLWNVFFNILLESDYFKKIVYENVWMMSFVAIVNHIHAATLHVGFSTRHGFGAYRSTAAPEAESFFQKFKIDRLESMSQCALL